MQKHLKLGLLAVTAVLTLGACNTATSQMPTPGGFNGEATSNLREAGVGRPYIGQESTTSSAAAPSGKLSAQGTTVTYTKLANWGQSFTVPQGVNKVYLAAAYNLGSYPDTNNSAAVTPGTVRTCDASLLGWTNTSYACYKAVITPATYHTDKIELFNRWSSAQSSQYNTIWYKLQISSAVYSRGDSNTEWLGLSINYTPTSTEATQARNYFTQIGEGNAFYVTNSAYLKLLYANYLYRQAGFTSQPWDVNGPSDRVVIN